MHNEFKKLREAMRNNAIFCPVDIVADGEVHRFSNKGEINKSSWYVLHENSNGSFGGVYGDWKMGKSYKWSSFKGTASPQQQQDMKRSIDQAKQFHKNETTERHHKASLKAREIWSKLNDSGTSPYLKTKQVKAYGIRFGSSEPISIPLCDISGKLWSLQFIDSKGGKRFLKGGKKKGCFHTLGVLDTSSQIYVCEGYATAASLYEATDVTMVVAFD